MKEEELIKKLENTELPRIEVKSHKCRLRMALLKSHYFEEHPRGIAVFKSKMKGGIDTMKGLISWRPVWKPALVGTLAVALIAVLAVTIPPHLGQSPEVLAREIAEQDPRIEAFLEKGGTFTQAVNVEEMQGDFYRVIFELPEKGEGQTIVNALVDLDDGKLVKLERGYIPPLTEEQKERAIQIAKSDSRVQQFLDRGATVYKVTPLPSFN
jgi:hypothetical protein